MILASTKEPPPFINPYISNIKLKPEPIKVSIQRVVRKPGLLALSFSIFSVIRFY